MHEVWVRLLPVWLAFAIGCGGEEVGPAADPSATDDPPAKLGALLEPQDWSWDDVLEKRVLRVLVTYSDTHFFLDQGRQRGITADALSELGEYLNQKYATGTRRLQVVPIPVTRDRLLDYLEEGRGDVAIANLTVTPERAKRVDFTVPTSRPFNEIVVSGPRSPRLERLEDLAGQTVQVPRVSSYWSSLERLNESFRDRKLETIDVVEADPYLETEDLLEMVDAGLIAVTVVDEPLARFWSQVLPGLVLHSDLVVAEGSQTAWAIRKGVRGLKEVLDPWIETNRQGTLLGNTLLQRYLQSADRLENLYDDDRRRRVLEMVPLFEKYGAEYGIDPLLLAALAFQESGLDQSKVSPVGAIGVMQVMPATARDPAVGIPDIEKLEPNIHAGTRYLAHLIDLYFDDPALDANSRALFAFAGYNAGPNRIARLREVARQEGLDPNRWFGNVEIVVAREVGREPVQYVAHIYKYYIAYTLIFEEPRSRRQRVGA